MLTRAQEKLILSLHHKNGRRDSGLCLVEGEKMIKTAGDAVDFIFTAQDTDRFQDLVTTETPQQQAAVARIPHWSLQDISQHSRVVVLDGVQDPGNVGSILRLCFGFDASLVLVDSADVTSPKVVRSSVGTLFHVPWMNVSRDDVDEVMRKLRRPIFRLEKNEAAQDMSMIQKEERCILIAGSEGNGIQLPTAGTSVAINHNPALESLNVGHALAIALAMR